MVQLWHYAWLQFTLGGSATGTRPDGAGRLDEAGLRGWEAVAAVPITPAAGGGEVHERVAVLLKRPAGSAHPLEIR